MTEDLPAHGVDPAALLTFMKRVRAALGHDLRTPLGTIVNYASVLEEDAGLDDEMQRELPRRIRCQAMQSAEMLQLLLDAMLLAAALPAYAPADPNELLRAVVADIEGDSALRAPASPKPADGCDTILLEAEVVRFVWRAFMLLEQSVSSRRLSSARATVEQLADHVRLGLAFGRKADEGAEPVDIDVFVRGAAVELPTTHRFGLRLARDLVAARGAELQLCGRVGADATIYLNIPRST